MRFALASSISLAFAATCHAATWKKTHSIVGAQFYDEFRFDNIPDPTNGRVEYVDAATARANNLTYACDDTFILRADHTNRVAACEPGRKSVRLVSLQKFEHHVATFDVRHMPQGCGAWPAIWEAGLVDWPSEGEVDILEGSNDVSPNQMTLHTSPGCTMPADRDQTGIALSTDCDTTVNNNAGCGAADTRENSFGPSFNANGGGFFAMERTGSFIKLWFWPRDGCVPADVRDGDCDINTDTWGTPTAFFPDSECDIDGKFAAHNIIINLTFCGDRAGSLYSSDGCPGTCVDLVDNYPSAFVDAYFDIGFIRVYQ